MIRGTRNISTQLSRKYNSCKRFCSTTDKTKLGGDGKKDYIGIALFSGICIAAAGLGAWQVQRFFWKQKLVEAIKDSAAAPPQTVAICSDQNQFCQQLLSLKGQRVLLTGRFEHSKEVYLGLRSAPPSFGSGPAQGMATNPQGYYVITPLLRDDGTVVHVNRGWVPRAMVLQKQPGQTAGTSEGTLPASKPTTQQQPAVWSRPEGVVSVEVVIGEGEKAGRFSPVNQPGTTAMLWLDPATLLARTGCIGRGGAGNAADCVIIAEAIDNGATTDTSNCFPYAKSVEQLQEQSVPPATHFVYALTWFSLATAGFYMTYTRFRRGTGKGKLPR